MIPLCVVDAFADRPFSGNPAAVCVLPAWPSEEALAHVGAEMNLSETAFVVPVSPSVFELRWFTPAFEVSLCGHATLASAHLLWERGHAPVSAPITFRTRQSGELVATYLPGGEIELNFPAQPAAHCPAPPGLLAALGAPASAPTAKNVTDYLVELPSDAAVRALTPDFGALARTDCRGVIATAPSADPRFDFVSRFFAPGCGVNEDPVTGSAHCCLAVWWGERFGKTGLVGYQASARGGVVRVTRCDDRVRLIGRAVTVTRGELVIPL